VKELAAVRVVKQATHVITQMEHQSPEWLPDLHELGRQTLGRVLQQDV
jgi:hypothetical protein